MAKQTAKKNDLPTVDELPEEVQQDQPQASATVEEYPIRWKTIKVPLLEGHELPQFLRKPRLDMRQITHRQQNVIHQLGNALLAIGEVTNNGSPPRYRGRVVAWLLEQLAD